jgi:hypothetical protein
LIPAQCRRIAESAVFTNFILGVIIFTAVLMGLETSAPLMTAYGPLFRVLNGVVQAIFVAEIVIRLAAHWPRPGRFFRDGWNVFDFLIVAASLLPQTGAFAMVARLARLLRVARLLSGFRRTAPYHQHDAALDSQPGQRHVVAGIVALRLQHHRLSPVSCARPEELGHAAAGVAHVVPDAHT